ncbi:hypothetical protein [Cupriavidus sp. CuC1]|uniref:hypothetical protein n=1 Tax=Cupriavidus sp. CuC1 TaxID=3373131 RepID=UPI0037D7E0BF
MATKRTTTTWVDVRAKLADFDRAGLLSLVQDNMYAASTDNQVFLHARFGLGDDVLKPYKIIIARWICPDPSKNQDISVAKAKKGISDYKKAIGQPEGLAELMVFYCEHGARFSSEFGLGDEGYLDALVRMFENALVAIENLPEAQRQPLRMRLEAVSDLCRDVGYGVSELLAEFGVNG